MDSLSSLKEVESAGVWGECDVCHDEFKSIIYVDDVSTDFCFSCYRTRFGLKRFMRKLRDMSLEAQAGGWVKK